MRPLLATPARADSEAAAAIHSTLQPMDVVVLGENYCLGCGLKGAHGASAQCSVHGHRHALRIVTATDVDGTVIEALAGMTLHYLDNDASAPLASGEQAHGAEVEVKGKLFPREATLQVESFEAK